MHETGIPIDALFGTLGFLVTAVYLDLKREVRSLRRGAIRRDKKLDRFRIFALLACKALNLPFANVLEETDGDDTKY